MPEFSTIPNPPSSESKTNGATTGYERELWRMTDALRGSMDVAEFRHVVLKAPGEPERTQFNADRVIDERDFYRE